jgi:hypothetical protein
LAPNQGEHVPTPFPHGVSRQKLFKAEILEKMVTFMIKARAHKGGVRIGKTPKKLASICCP